MSTPAYKKRARQLAQKRAAELRKYEEFLKPIKASTKSRKKEFKEYAPKSSVRNEPSYPSFTSKNSIPGACAKKERNQYTGDYIVGIATMHKSNLVPVSRKQNPEDYAKMRRN